MEAGRRRSRSRGRRRRGGRGRWRTDSSPGEGGLWTGGRQVASNCDSGKRCLCRSPSISILLPLLGSRLSCMCVCVGGVLVKWTEEWQLKGNGPSSGRRLGDDGLRITPVLACLPAYACSPSLGVKASHTTTVVLTKSRHSYTHQQHRLRQPHHQPGQGKTSSIPSTGR